MHTSLRRLTASALAVAAPVALAVVGLVSRGEVPDPVPVHWNIHGEVDDTAGVAAVVGTALTISALLALATLAAIWLSHSTIAGRMLASLLAFGAWVAAATAIATLIASYGAASAADVTMTWYQACTIVIVPAVLGAATWALLPGRWPHAHPVGSAVGSAADSAVGSAVGSAAAPLAVAADEPVTWVGHAHSVPIRIAAAVAALVGAVMVFVRPSVAIPLCVAAVVLALVSELAVRIDDGGVHTLWGPFGWPRPHIALTEIAAASAQDISPMAWGGWGYRVSSRGVAAVVRRGPGLVIDRATGPTYVVTVDDAARGAAVLGALVARARG